MSCIKSIAEISRIPSLDTARLVTVNEESFIVEVTYTVKEYEPLEPCKSQFEAIYLVSRKDFVLKLVGINPVTDMRKFKSISPSERWIACGVERKVKDKMVPFLEVLPMNTKQYCYDRYSKRDV
jgi:hypothetical protein